MNSPVSVVDFFPDEVLRLHPEPCREVDARTIHQLMAGHPQESFRFVRDTLQDIAQGHLELQLPPKQLFDERGDGGDWRVMPAVLLRGDEPLCTVAKLSGTNRLQERVPDQVSVGKTFAIDAQENFISHAFDGCVLSSLSAALCAATAVAALADGCAELSVLGAGRVGYYAALLCAANHSVRRVTFVDPAIGRAATAASALRTALPHLECRSAESASDCEVMILATTSSEPVVASVDTDAPLVVSLGADSNSERELHDDWVGAARLFVDTVDSVRYGDLRRWEMGGMLDGALPADLMSVLRHPVAEKTQRRRVFISTGSALFDLLSVFFLLQQFT